MWLNFSPERKPAIFRMQNLHCSLGQVSWVLKTRFMTHFRRKKLALVLDLEVSMSKSKFSQLHGCSTFCVKFLSVSAAGAVPAVPEFRFRPHFPQKTGNIWCLLLVFLQRKSFRLIICRPLYFRWRRSQWKLPFNIMPVPHWACNWKRHFYRLFCCNKCATCLLNLADTLL